MTNKIFQVTVSSLEIPVPTCSTQVEVLDLPLTTLGTSGFVDAVTFSHNWLYGGVSLLNQPRCNLL